MYIRFVVELNHKKNLNHASLDGFIIVEYKL